MRPRSVRIGEALFVLAVFITGVFMVIDNWNKDGPSSNMHIGITLIIICVINGVFMAIRAWRNKRARATS